MSAWPLVPLASAIQYRKEFVQIDDLSNYKRCRVQLHAQGIVLRDTVPGAEIKTKKQQVCKAGDFLVAEIDAKVGGFGIVPEELDQAIVSSHYFLFEVNGKVLNRRFLDFFIRTPAFREQVAAQGSTNYAAIRPNDVLGYKLPLPPLPEQQRIVARIEALSARIDEARGLRQQAVQDEERLLVCMAHREDLPTNEKLRSGWFETTVGRICRFTDESESVDGSRSYPNLGIFSYGRGVFPKPSIEGVATSAKKLRRVRAGQFIYSRLFAFEGAYAMVPPELDGHYVSGEYPTFTCDPTKACAEFLWAHFRSPNVWQTVAAGSKGLGNRRQRVQPDRVLEYRLWVPPMEWQRKIQSVQTKVDALKKLQGETAAELAALLPSILDKAFKGEL
jgi:type I restriction enzyme S subunit